MGTYTSLSVGGYEIYSTRGYADSVAMTIFTENDRYERVVRVDETGQHHPVDCPVPEDLVPDEDDQQVDVGYAAPGWKVRDRLEVMGFTLEATRREFEAGIADRIEELRAWSEDDPAIEVLWKSDLDNLESLSFEIWLRTFASLVARRLYSWRLTAWSGNPEPAQVSPLEKFMLEDHHGLIIGFPPNDIRYLIRAAIEACGLDTVVEQDLTGVVHAGYYWLHEQVAHEAREGLLNDFPANAKIVVLTEGKTDGHALEGALKLLYPHLVEYYAFMDFEGASVAGGAGPLVATLKAFAGAGIANRTVALFDNDTAARVALRGLMQVQLPSNIRVLTYPRLPLAENYPTMGPNGLSEMDVNGLAGALELYFGEDILAQDDGSLTPVQWKGYEGAVRGYQGELMNKPALQGAFSRKLKEALANPDLINSQDWEGMRAILDVLRSAFATPNPTIRPTDR